MEGVMPLIGLSQTPSLTHPVPAVLIESVLGTETTAALGPAPYQSWLRPGPSQSLVGQVTPSGCRTAPQFFFESLS